MITDLVVIIILSLIIVAQMIERYFHTQQYQQEKSKLLDELSKMSKAVISKNANDYVMTASIDKVAPEPPAPTDPDLIPEESLTDEEFMKAIHKDLTPKEES
jgi:hypothetical protein